jgi:hypothetical protein
MIDTDKYEGHSEDEWILVDDEYIVMNNKTGNVAKFDSRHVKISQSDMNLMLDAPLLLQALTHERAEVKRLREYLKPMRQLRECLWWCYDKERFGWDIDVEAWAVIGRLLGADTDHNDNEWGEEE